MCCGCSPTRSTTTTTHATSPRSVERLNVAYTQARLDDFGLDAGDYAKGESKADGDYDADWQASSTTLIGSLTAEYRRLGAWLDARAEQVARMLDRGPNPDDVTTLWAAGALPPDAIELWPRLVEVPVLRLPYELRDGAGDRRSLYDLSQDDLAALWEEDGFEPARELVGERVAHDIETNKALREFNLKMNPLYWKALSEGLPEKVARLIAEANPHSFFEIAAPYVMAGESMYGVTVRDLVDAARHDPLSLRTLAELAMVTPTGKIRKVEELLNAIGDARDAERTADAVDDARTVDRIGGPDEFDPSSLRGTSADDVVASIPDGWKATPSKRGGGVVFEDPAHKGRQLRIMPGYPAGSRPDPMTAGPYVVVSQNGDSIKIPLAGNPTLG